MTFLFQQRFRRAAATVAVSMLVIATIAVSAPMTGRGPAEAGTPQTGANQQVSNHANDLLFRHGVHAWSEDGHDGTGVKVGIIDSGFDGWRMASLQGRLPTPPGLDEQEGNSRVKTKCYAIGDNGLWGETTFEGCEAPNHEKASSNYHGTAVAETIYEIAPGVEFYISNAPGGSAERAALEWMHTNGVHIINRSLHGNYLAPGDGSAYSGTTNSDIHNLKYIMELSDSNVLFVNSAGNHAQTIWSGPYASADNDSYIDIRNQNGERDRNKIDLNTDDKVTIELRWDDTWGTPNTAGATCNLNMGIYQDGSRVWLKTTRNQQTGGNNQKPFEEIVDLNITDTDDYHVAIWRSGTCTNPPDWIQMRILGTGGSFDFATPHGPLGSAPDDKHFQLASVQEATFDNSDNGADYLVVAGSNRNHGRNERSSYGPTNYHEDSDSHPDRPDVAGSWCSEYRRAGLGEFCGTSNAAPVVTGLAALVKDGDSSKTGKQIAAYLRGKADHASGNYDFGLGHGVAFLDGAILLHEDSGQPPTEFGHHQTQAFYMLFNDTDAPNGVKVRVGSNLSLNSDCNANREASKTVVHNAIVNIKGCAAGTANIVLEDDNDDEVEYRTYATSIRASGAGNPNSCETNRGRVSAGATWTSSWTSDCGQIDGAGNSHLQTFQTSLNQYKEYQFTLPLSKDNSLRLWHGSNPPRQAVGDAVDGAGSSSASFTTILPPNRHYTLETTVDNSAITGTHRTSVTVTNADEAPAVTGMSVRSCASTVADPDCLKVSWDVVDGIDNLEIAWRNFFSLDSFDTKTIDSVGRDSGISNQTQSITLDASDGISCGSWYQVVIKPKGDGIVYLPELSTNDETRTGRATACPSSVSFPQPTYSYSAPANTAVNSRLVQVTASVETGDGVDYSIVAGNPNDTFAIETTTGWISLAKQLTASSPTSYSLTVRGTSRSDSTQYADTQVNITTLDTIPAPTSVSAGSATRSSINVSWSAVTNATKYQLQYRVGSLGAWRTATSSATSTSHTVSGLDCGTTYQFRVAAYGDGTNFASQWGAWSSAYGRTSSCLSLAPAPSSFSGTGNSKYKVPLTWSAVSGVTKYRVMYRAGTSGTWLPATSSETGTSYTVTDLDCETAYQFRVQGYGNGTSYRPMWGNAATVSVTTSTCPPLPLAPNGLETSTGFRNHVPVDWLENDEIAKWRVEYRQGASGAWTVWRDDIPDEHVPMSDKVKVDVNGLICDSSYQFRVSAYGKGEARRRAWGPASAAVSGTTGDCEMPYFIPVNLSWDPLWLDPDLAIGATAFTVVAYDETANDVLRYSIVGGDTRYFSVNSATGEVTVRQKLGNGPFVVDFEVRDQTNQTDRTSVWMFMHNRYTASLDKSKYTVLEGKEATRAILTLDRPATEPVKISWTLDLGTGVEAEELNASPGYHIFHIGESSRAILLFSAEDDVAEGLEKVTLSLDASNTRGKIVRGDLWEANVYIEDDDVEDHVLWSTNMTVGKYHGTFDAYGYSETVGVDGQPDGSLGAETFDWYGTEYEVTDLMFTHSNTDDPEREKISIAFDQAAPSDLSQTYLQIGTARFDLETPSYNSRGVIQWNNPGLDLRDHVGENLKVKLFQRQSSN